MILTVASCKGGVSKTTTAVSVAARLAMGGAMTILADLDQQGHAAMSLGFDPAPGVFDWLVGERRIIDVIRITRMENLALIPGDSRTKTVERVYSAEPEPHGRVVVALGELHVDYSAHLVIDSSASGLLQEAAIAAADVLVIPVRLEHLGVDGVNATLALRDRLNPCVRTIVLPTQYDARLSEHKYNLGVLENLNGDDGGIPFHGFELAQAIPARVAVAEAVACGLTVYEYTGRGIRDVQDAYTALVKLIEGGGE